MEGKKRLAAWVKAENYYWIKRKCLDKKMTLQDFLDEAVEIFVSKRLDKEIPDNKKGN